MMDLYLYRLRIKRKKEEAGEKRHDGKREENEERNK